MIITALVYNQTAGLLGIAWNCGWKITKLIPANSIPQPVTTMLDTLLTILTGIRVYVASPTAESRPQNNATGVMAK